MGSLKKKILGLCLSYYGFWFHLFLMGWLISKTKQEENFIKKEV